MTPWLDKKRTNSNNNQFRNLLATGTQPDPGGGNENHHQHQEQDAVPNERKRGRERHEAKGNDEARTEALTNNNNLLQPQAPDAQVVEETIVHLLYGCSSLNSIRPQAMVGGPSGRGGAQDKAWFSVEAVRMYEQMLASDAMYRPGAAIHGDAVGVRGCPAS